MAKDKDRMQQWIDEQSEWQENQYNPGHWVDGRLPRNLLNPAKPRVLGAFLLLVGIGLAGGGAYVLTSLDMEPGAIEWLGVAGVALLGVLQALLGLILGIRGIQILRRR